jgi:hypothetical protein
VWFPEAASRVVAERMWSKNTGVFFFGVITLSWAHGLVHLKSVISETIQQ